MRVRGSEAREHGWPLWGTCMAGDACLRLVQALGGMPVWFMVWGDGFKTKGWLGASLASAWGWAWGVEAWGMEPGREPGRYCVGVGYDVGSVPGLLTLNRPALKVKFSAWHEGRTLRLAGPVGDVWVRFSPCWLSA